jgi:hypothetical protein
MSIIDKIVGLVPTVREKAKAALGLLVTPAGKIGLAALVALAILGFTHHLGVSSQSGTIESLRRDLGSVRLQLAAEQSRPKAAPVCPEPPAPIAEPVQEPAKPAEVTKPKVKIHAPLAKHPARSGARLSPAESGWLSNIR